MWLTPRASARQLLLPVTSRYEDVHWVSGMSACGGVLCTTS